MKLNVLLVLFGLVLSACTQAPKPSKPVPPQASLPGATIYACSGGNIADERIEALYDTVNNTATVVFAGKTYVLPLTPSGSGARYSNGSITWWTKGDEALWQMDENLVLRDCRQDG